MGRVLEPPASSLPSCLWEGRAAAWGWGTLTYCVQAWVPSPTTDEEGKG